MKLTNTPLISVIVPVYDTEKYLRKCLDSILGQTYKNIELIIVNDGSKDDSEKIIKEYLREYDNIKYVRHKENRGLFQARISGAEEAAGDYIAFVDSDDYISLDYYRLLVRKAIETDADMVVGNFYLEYENGLREYFNLDPFHIQEVNISNEDVLKTYMEQEGLCYTYQLVWNKLYNKKLWDKGINFYKDFAEMNQGLTMTEDIAFSSCFWVFSKKVSSTQNAAYFYCQRPGQSTDNVTQNKLVQHLNDTIAVFDFFKKVLVEHDKYIKYKGHYNNWRKLYGRINYNNFLKSNLIDKYAGIIKQELFLNEKMCGMTYEDGFFYSIKTPLSKSFKWYEDIKQSIIDENTKYVSFDIFDTLVIRPFWLPTDLFYLMNSYFMELTKASSDIDFAQIRIESERLCRQELNAMNSSFDDITIKEIYRTMHNKYYISEDTCQKLMNKEIELEIRFCTKRKTGFELYQLAIDLDKEVFFTSDMYLDKDTIISILKKNKYNNYTRLFLSSEVRLGKWSGKLYKHILKEYEIDNPNFVLHIGDNWNSDVEMPRKFGIRSCHLDKTVNIFSNINSGIYSGEGFSQSFVNNSTGRDLNGGIWGFMGLRTMLAMVANKFFDNPYVNFNNETDFNANPSYIGYYTLGMHIYGLVSWLFENIKNSDAKTIHFVARDGYIVKRAYDILNTEEKYSSSNYLYLSRKALAFADVISPIDMYSLINKLNIKNTSPQKFLAMFNTMIDKNRLYNINDNLIENGFFKTEKFANREEFERFIYYFIKNVWKDIDWSTYRNNLKQYFKGIIKKDDLLFDIGYSGRSESALNCILGYSINSYYIHSNSEVLNRRMKSNNFKNNLFYDYKPYITGVMREHMFMKLAPSTICYDFNEEGELKPVFEKYYIDPATKYVTEVVQNSAIDFVKDLKKIFDGYIENLYARKEDLSQPFEYYIHYGKKLDRNIFSTLMFEDDFGEGKKLRAVDFWSSEIERMLNLQNNIELANRVINKSEYIGISAVEYYTEKDEMKINRSTSSPAIFLDHINDDDSIDDKFSKSAGNTTNQLEWDSIEKQINPVLIPNWYMTHQGGFNEKDHEIYLTTNLTWIEENTDLTYLASVLERIGDRILLPVSMGFSTTDGHKNFKLSDNSIKMLSAIAERCKSIGVKGEYSADILESFGIKNIDIIGTPSVYQNIEQMKSIKTIAEINGISASFKPFFGRLSIREKKLLNYLADNGTRLIDTTALELNKANLGEDKIFSRIKEWEKKKSVYFDINEWGTAFNDIDFSIGMNFANNIIAMQASVAALFICYESIGRELCKHYSLPCIEISDFDERKKMIDYYRLVDLSEFKKSIDKRYKEYCSFLEKNRIKISDIESRIIEK